MLLFSTQKETLLSALEVANKAIPSKTIVQALEGFKIEVKDGKVFITGSDLDTTINTSFSVIDYQNGAIVIEASLFTEYVKKLNGNISIKQTEENRIEISSGKSKSVMICNKADEYPEIKKNDEKPVLANVVQSEFLEALTETLYTVAKEEIRPILTGINFKMQYDEGKRGGFLTLAGLDGYRFAYRTLAVDSEEKVSVTVPAKGLQQLIKLLKNNDKNIKISFYQNTITFELENETKIQMRLLEGEFIPYEKIIPGEFKEKLIINREELLESIGRVSLMAGDKQTPLVIMNLSADNITISADSNTGNAVDQIKPIAYEGEPLKIAFNSNYWKQLLNSLTCKQVECCFNSNVNPVVVRKYEDKKEIDNYIGLVLPVRIASANAAVAA